MPNFNGIEFLRNKRARREACRSPSRSQCSRGLRYGGAGPGRDGVVGMVAMVGDWICAPNGPQVDTARLDPLPHTLVASSPEPFLPCVPPALTPPSGEVLHRSIGDHHHIAAAGLCASNNDFGEGKARHRTAALASVSEPAGPRRSRGGMPAALVHVTSPVHCHRAAPKDRSLPPSRLVP